MSAFLKLLMVYYLCDSAAALHPLPGNDAAHCVQSYERVKSAFLPPGAQVPAGAYARARQSRAAYLRFKSWEANHPELVARLKPIASAQAGS